MQVFNYTYNTAHVQRYVVFGTRKNCAICERFLYLLYPLSP